MRKSFLKTFGYLACLAWSGVACAVGFGGINVTSSLGQPLSAEIELVAVDQSDKASLSARLATQEAFKGAGIDYPFTLPKMKFSVETRANGESYIKATSTQPVNEPFVSLLIELTWSSGRLLREYTFLLDPPGFVAEQPAVAAVKPIEPVIVAPVAASAPVATPEPVPQVEPVAAASAPVAAEMSQTIEAASAPVAAETKPAEPAAMPEPQPAKEEAKPAPASAKESTPAADITTKRGDTLSKIATATKASDVSLERMLVALYRSNAEAFDGKNMNRLRTGKILHLPQEEELSKLQQAEAVSEVRAQTADWNAYRQQLAGATAPASEQHAKQEVSGKVSTAVVDKAPAAKESAKEVLKLSKGEAPGDQTAAGGKAKSAKDRANAKEEDSVAKAKALKEAEQRTALLEKNIKDMQRLVELKNQAAAKATQSSAASSVASAASAVAVAKPKPVAPKVVAPPPSFVDDLLENPIILGGGAAVILGLGGLVFMRTRKQSAGGKKPKTTVESDDSAGHIAAPVAPSRETGDFTDQFAAATMATTVDEVDPVGEADMFLNFGRDVQAEEVLKDALSKDPANNPVKLKLLSIYANRKDTKSFYVYAMEIKESGDTAAWAQAAAMGLALEPSNAIYGGNTGEVASPVVEEAALPAVDFDLGLAGNEAATTVDLHGGMKSDVPAGEQTSIMSLSELQAAQEAPMDFDVTSTRPGLKAAAEEPKLDVAAMDFDVTGTHPGITGGAAAEPELDMPALDFDVTGSQGKAAPITAVESVEQTPALNLDDLVFETPAKPVAAPQPAPEIKADEGLAFTIDIPDIKPEATAKPAAPVQDMGLGDISLNLDDAPATAEAETEVKDEHWQEVSTKLDLAKAYQEMGDQAGAREILEEVVRDGDEKQRATAQELLQQLA